ncbi:MAG TPA: GntR family transcriptional regulator [Gammaproteobacteria bacterium]|nr:GntR family transcriptional regulator [Gammaproteobacteria bacterium]
MNIEINVSAAEPVYEQIVRQIHVLVERGGLAPGTPLPPVRQLAADLELNPNTVARAYRLLEQQGVIKTAGRKGTFVRLDAADEVTRQKTGRAERRVRHLVETLVADGLSRQEIAELFSSTLALRSKRKLQP